MSETVVLLGNDPIQYSCLNRILESKWTDAVLITGFVALLIIGIVPLTGALNAIGITNASYLSYGMYVGSALFLTAAIIKQVFLNERSKKNNKVQVPL